MKNRVLSTMLVIALGISLLAGCGKSSSNDSNETNPLQDLNSMSKSQLLDYSTTLRDQYYDLSDKYEKAQSALDALNNDGQASESITTAGDGSGRFTFNSLDNKIIFKSDFTYPNSSPILPNGKINITSDVGISPSSTWISRINGSSLEIENASNNISGTIKVNQTEEQMTVDELQSSVIEPWVDTIAYSAVIYKDIFIEDAAFGKQAETPILIDNQDAYLICGMAAFGSYSITYVFVYRGAQDKTKSELITNMLNTVSIIGNNLTIQN